MPKLTHSRLKKAKGILDKHNQRLRAEVPGDIDVSILEAELLKCWSIDLQKLKGIMIEMFDRHPEYKELAIRYMKHFPCKEFHDSFHKYQEEGGDIWLKKGDPV